MAIKDSSIGSELFNEAFDTSISLDTILMRGMTARLIVAQLDALMNEHGIFVDDHDGCHQLYVRSIKPESVGIKIFAISYATKVVAYANALTVLKHYLKHDEHLAMQEL